MGKSIRFGKMKRILLIGIAAVAAVTITTIFITYIYFTKPDIERPIAVIRFFPREKDLDQALKSLHEGGHQPWRSNPLEVARIESPTEIAALLTQQSNSFELSYWKYNNAEVISKNAKQTAIIHLKSYKDEIWYISKITFLEYAEPSHTK